MNEAAYALAPHNPVLDLLDEQFSEAELRTLLDLDDVDVPVALLTEALYAPLHEFLRRPGKEFRQRLVELTWRLNLPTTPVPVELGLMVEILHAGSLIIDDIEDSSGYRRGAPALHALYGLPKALNAGNWLYFWPAQLLEKVRLPQERKVLIQRQIDRTLLQAHTGQALDLSVQVCELPQRQLQVAARTVTALKSGSLMRLAAGLGALGAGADDKRTRAAQRFGLELGTGLQMLDDFSGIFNQRRCHKGHEDLLGNRVTWVWAVLAQRLDELTYAKLVQQCRLVCQREQHPELLSQRIRDLLGDMPKAFVHDHLKRSVDELEKSFERSPITEQLRAEIALLEESYG